MPELPRQSSGLRYVVVVSRVDVELVPDITVDLDQVVLGPFRSQQRAEARAETVRRLAAKYEDPEGATGDDNCLSVTVRPIRAGSMAARDAMDYLYGSLANG